MNLYIQYLIKIKKKIKKRFNEMNERKLKKIF